MRAYIEMGINVIKRGIIMPLLLVCSHPFLFGMVSFMVLMYRYCPPLFGFLVSSSPVVGCTFLFLWIILNSSQHEPEEDQEKELSNSLVGIGNKHLPLKVNVDRDFAERRDVLFSSCSRNLFFNDGHDGGKNNVTVFDASSSIKDKKRIVDDERGKDIQGTLKAGRAVNDTSKVCQSGISILTNDDGRSDSGSDRDQERSFPDDPLEDPIFDELHPLLEAEPTESASVSNSDSLSIETSSISNDDGSEVEDTEIQENDDEEEEDDGEIQEGKNDGPEESVLRWTADDEKNVRDVGNSELERNHTLEQLIAKRRDRSFLRSETEKNLIDFDNSEPTAAVEELSRLLIHIPPRKNPFDIPDEAEGVIPGSAPSVLLPRKNPFDLPSPGDLLSSSNEIAAGESSHQDFPVFQQRDAVLRRNETFALGVSPTDYRHERGPTRFRPYFVAERMDVDELSYAKLDTQLSGISDSKDSSVLETESVSSDSDPSNHEIYKDTLDQDQDFLQQSGLASPSLSEDHERSSSDAVAAVVEEEVVVVVVEEEEVQEQEEDHYHEEEGSTEIDQDHDETNVDSLSEFNEIVTNGITDDSRTEIVKRHWMSVRSRMSYAMKRMMAEENLDESNMSSDTDSDDESSSHDSAASVIADSEMISHPDLDAHEHQIIGPVYDSSPSAIERSISNFNSIEEAFLYLNKDGLKSCSSLASDMQVEVSESGSPPILSGHNLYPGEELSSSGHWVASSHLSFIDQHESRTRELREIKEHDVIKVDFTGMDDFHNSPGVSLPKSAPESNEIEPTLSLHSSMEGNAIDVNEVKKEGGFSFDNMKNIVTPPLSLSKLVCGDDLASSTSFIPQPLPDDLVPPSPPSKFAIADSQISILPPILEDILEESKHEDDQDTLGPFDEDHNAIKNRSMSDDLEVAESNLNSTPSNLQVTNGTSSLEEVYLPGFGTEAVNFSDEHEDFRHMDEKNAQKSDLSSSSSFNSCHSD